MIMRVLKAAFAAGFLAACVAAALQTVLTSPLILQAETYEQAHPSQVHDVVHHSLKLAHEHPASPEAIAEEEWEPSGDLSRAVFTSLATLISGVGYALILAALILATGHEIGVGAAMRWALGGFLAVNLAPAVGLPPELPGMGGEHLAARQIWWIVTVFGTGLGLYLISAVRNRVAVALGVLAIGLPHAIGAPHADAAVSAVPAGLAAQFAARSLAVAFAFWATLGVALGWCWTRQEDRTGLGTVARRTPTASQRRAG